MTQNSPRAATAATQDSANPNLIKNGKFQEYSPIQFNNDWGGGGKSWAGGPFIAVRDELVIPGWSVDCFPQDHNPKGRVFNIWSGMQADLQYDQGNALHLHGIGFGDYTGFLSQEIPVEVGATYVVKFKLGTNTSGGHGAIPSWPLMGVAVSVDGSNEYAYEDRSLFFQTGEPFRDSTGWKNEQQMYGRQLAHWKEHSFRFTASEHRAILKFFCQQRGDTGPLLTAVECRKASAPFTVNPGDGPVTLKRVTETRYPGVQLLANDEGAVSPVEVTATLPAGRGLYFVPGEGLTVQGSPGGKYPGTLSPDKQALTFENVNLGLPGKGATSVMWVAVKADDGAPTGYTHLSFRVDDQSSDSTTLDVE